MQLNTTERLSLAGTNPSLGGRDENSEDDIIDEELEFMLKILVDLELRTVYLF
jgi:hypothetical protein